MSITQVKKAAVQTAKTPKAAIKTPKVPPTKVTITQPVVATQILRQYFKESTYQPYKIKGSQARYASVKQITDWYLANHNIALVSGWLGRSLQSAPKVASAITHDSAGREMYIYRLLH